MALSKSARTSIEWAESNIRDLEAHLAGFYAKEPYAAIGVDDPKTGRPTYKATHVEEVPGDIMRFTGQAFTQLRSALDLVISDIAASEGT